MTTTGVAPGNTSLRRALPAPDECRALVTSALHHGAPMMVAQPILGLSSGRVVAYEALARFGPELPSFSPDIWFSMAHECGLGAMFEARAVDLALKAGQRRPAGTLLSVNVSPSVLSSNELHDVLPLDLTGLQFEITEKQVVDDADHFSQLVAALRGRGARIAVDDVGEGYAGLQRVLSLSPDLIKLDRSLVTGVESEPVKAALVEAIVRYAANVGAEVCAEGVENLDDLYVLADLDVAEAQGWVIGLPSAEFEPATEAASITCQSSYQRTLALGSAARGPHSPGQDSTALERLLVDLVTCSELDELARMARPIADYLHCNLAEISFLDADRQYLQGIGALTWRPEGHRYPLADFPLTERCLQTLEIMTVDLDDPDADAAERGWMQVEGVTTMIGLPVLAAGSPVGLLECSRSAPVPWTRVQLRHARIIATVLGPVISSLQARSHTA